MEQRPLTNEQILDALYELAEDSKMTVEDYIKNLQSESETALAASRDGLPEEVITELDNAKRLKKESRSSEKQSKQNAHIKKEIVRFKELFPKVRPEDIPDSVWEDVAEGVPLSYAYALYRITESKADEYASRVNDENSTRATSRTGSGDTEPSFTKEQVETMSPKEVSKNYKHILKSIAKWKL
jgi:hypothetical protein